MTAIGAIWIGEAATVVLTIVSWWKVGNSEPMDEMGVAWAAIGAASLAGCVALAYAAGAQ